MPPKRKLKGASGDDKAAAVPEKKAKAAITSSSASSSAVAAASQNYETVWLWESSTDKWKLFEDETVECINNAMDARKKQVVISKNSEDHVLNFLKMICTSKDSGEEVRICSCVRSKDSKNSVCYRWYWKDDSDQIRNYTPSQTLLLESAFQRKEIKVAMKLGNRNYTFNFKEWTQLANTSQEEHKVHRIKIDIEAPESISPMKNKSTAEEKQKSAKNTKSKTIESESSKVKTIIMNGKRPVDSECIQKIETAHVYCEENDVWDALLNQTNLQFNNNKFYIIQLLEENSRKSYSVWFRWGRIGKRGQHQLIDCGSNLELAKAKFSEKFFSKTGNYWDDRCNFQKHLKKYDLLHIDYSPSDKGTEEEGEGILKKIPTIPESKLDKRVKSLIEMICNIKAMEEVVMEMKFDAQKAPLGKLTADQIKSGYSALKRIEELIDNKVSGLPLIEACNDFYTRIPHNFGVKTPPLITKHSEIQEKVALLGALGDIQVAMKILNQRCNVETNPTDSHYSNLNCELTPLDESHPDYKLLQEYLMNTHAATHNQYSLTIEGIFCCNKIGEKDRFNNVGNRMLLWHGSRLSNWAGILSKGLRIAPPEAPVSGYMFGKGVYFADMCSKSANYCFASPSLNSGLLLLCEVALGECRELTNADYYASNLPKEKHSVKGRGRIVPDPNYARTLSDGTVVPMGKGIDTAFYNQNGYTLNYNEYIVYDVNQIRMRYLIQVKFNFNH